LQKITTTQIGIISNLENEIIQHKKNIEDKDKLIGVCEDEKKSLTKEIRKQKRGKWIAIIGGIGGVFLTTFILTL
jgi:ribosomal protein S6